MTVIDTFYLLFKNQGAKEQRAEVEALDKQISALAAKGTKRTDAEKKQLNELRKSRQEMTRDLKDQGREIDKIGESYIKVIEGAVGALTAFTSFASIKNGIMNAEKINSALEVQGKITHQNVTEMKAYSAAVEAMGGSPGAFGGFLQNAFMQAANAGLPLPGVDVLMKRIHDQIQGLSKNEQARRLGLLGITDPGMIALLEQSNEEFAKSIALAKAHAQVTEADTLKAREFEKAWRGTAQSLESSFTKLGSDVFPAITPLLKDFGDFIDHTVNSTGGVEAFFTVAVAGVLALTTALSRAALVAVGARAGLGVAGGASLGFLGGLVGAGVGYEEYKGEEDAIKGTRNSAMGKASQSLADWIVNTYQGPIKRYGGNSTTKDAKSESLAFWIAQGYTPAQAAGIVANEQAESGFNPSAVGDGGAARGSFQWHKDRRMRILAGTGIDVERAGHLDQLRAAAWELQKTGIDKKIKAANNESDAAMIFSQKFEVANGKSGNSYIEAMRRAGMATRIAGGASISAATGGGKSLSVKIDEVNVHTQATDAKGIAREMGGALQGEIRNVISNMDDGIKG